MDRIKEEVRHERGVTLIEEAVSDIRAAFRQMRHHPVVAGVIVLTLAVGVGFNTAVFTVVKTVVLGELPYSAADRLVVLWSDSKSYSPAPALSGPDFFDYRDQTTRLEGIAAAWGNRGGLNAPGGAPEYVQWAKVSANFFEVLRVTPAVGARSPLRSTPRRVPGRRSSATECGAAGSVGIRRSSARRSI